MFQTLAEWLTASVLSATLDEDTHSDFQEEEYLDIHSLVSLLQCRPLLPSMSEDKETFFQTLVTWRAKPYTAVSVFKTWSRL